MPETVQQVVDDVRLRGGFDVDEPTTLRYLNRKWRQMVGEARALRKTVAVATTTTAAFYPFSPVEAYSFELAGVPYGKARRPDKYADSQGALWVSPDEAGLILADADATGARGVTLIPAPSAGLALTSFAAVLPADLTVDAPGNALLLAVLEDDFLDGLVAGTVGLMLGTVRRRKDLAPAYEADFQVDTERLRLRTKRRFRGQGPTQIRVVGVNA